MISRTFHIESNESEKEEKFKVKLFVSFLNCSKFHFVGKYKLKSIRLKPFVFILLPVNDTEIGFVGWIQESTIQQRMRREKDTKTKKRTYIRFGRNIRKRHQMKSIKFDKCDGKYNFAWKMILTFVVLRSTSWICMTNMALTRA